MPHGFSLPFTGRAWVAWGGDTQELNHHHAHPVQKFGFDFAGVPDAAGRRCSGRGEANEDYFIFGRPILAPADGVVVEAVDGIRDNRPRQPYERMPSGNYVLIRHADSAFSHLSHLRCGSVAVRAGESVQRGQVIAACGNSGRSTEPHLHFHLQSDDRTGAPIGTKCWFGPILVGGNPQPDYSPVRGDVVENAIRA